MDLQRNALLGRRSTSGQCTTGREEEEEGSTIMEEASEGPYVKQNVGDVMAEDRHIWDKRLFALEVQITKLERIY